MKKKKPTIKDHIKEKYDLKAKKSKENFEKTVKNTNFFEIFPELKDKNENKNTETQKQRKEKKREEIAKLNNWIRENYPNDRYLDKDFYFKLRNYCKQLNIDIKQYYTENRNRINPKVSLVAFVENSTGRKLVDISRKELDELTIEFLKNNPPSLIRKE